MQIRLGYYIRICTRNVWQNIFSALSALNLNFVYLRSWKYVQVHAAQRYLQVFHFTDPSSSHGAEFFLFYFWMQIESMFDLSNRYEGLVLKANATIECLSDSNNIET
jgi:hypothetical protein